MRTFIALYLEMPSCNRNERFFRETRKKIYEIICIILFESISQLREHFNVTTTIDDSDKIIKEK